MILSIISAVAENRVIGNKNSLPWHLPEDFKWFKENTMNKTIVMGLNTFNSIGGKPLPNRKNIILNNDSSYVAPENCFVAKSIPELLEMVNPVRNTDQLKEYAIIGKKIAEGNLDKLSAEIFRKKLSVGKISNGVKDETEVMICGGAFVYKQMLPLANRLYLTQVHASPEGDAFFPEFNLADWKEISRTESKADEKNQYNCSFVVLERK